MPQQTCGLRTMEGGTEKKKPQWTPSRATEGFPSKACISTFSAPDNHDSSTITSCNYGQEWKRMFWYNVQRQIDYCSLVKMCTRYTVLTLTLIQSVSMWTYWSKPGLLFPTLSRWLPIWSGPPLNPKTFQCTACCGVLQWSIPSIPQDQDSAAFFLCSLFFVVQIWSGRLLPPQICIITQILYRLFKCYMHHVATVNIPPKWRQVL